jgi:hypothetical protein
MAIFAGSFEEAGLWAKVLLLDHNFPMYWKYKGASQWFSGRSNFFMREGLDGGHGISSAINFDDGCPDISF